MIPQKNVSEVAKVKVLSKIVKKSELIAKELENPFSHDFSDLPEKKNLFDPNPKLIEKAYKTCSELWVKDDKSRNFLKHIIASFLPHDPFMKMVYKPENEIFKCAILGINLTGIKNIAEGVTKIGMKKMFIDAHANIEKRDYSAEETKELNDARNLVPIEIREGSYAIMSETSDKVISREAVVALRIFMERLMWMMEYEKDVKFLVTKMKLNNSQEDVDTNKLTKSEINIVAKAMTFGTEIKNTLDSKTLTALEKLRAQFQGEETDLEESIANIETK